MDESKAQMYITGLEEEIEFCENQSARLSYQVDPFKIAEWDARKDGLILALSKFKQLFGIVEQPKLKA